MTEGKHAKKEPGEVPSEPDEITAEPANGAEAAATALLREEAAGPGADDHAPQPTDGGVVSAPKPGKVFSGYGIASAILGLVSVAALVFSAITWSMHRRADEEGHYRTEVKKTAAEWASLLLNINKDNAERVLHRLREQTTGPLNAEFDPTLMPFRDTLLKLQSRGGRVEAVAIVSLPQKLDLGTAPAAAVSRGTRTETVLVLATSGAVNKEGKPQRVYWNLLLNVSDAAGKFMISGLQPIR
ncbi:hypothetical protein [Mycobacterium botniense]|uniref:hypothetical protein n=1 Tax=Mycobacterium botniense TaxID=84962 RepID=UPI0013D4C2CD|nr:hypothetical protein [Mycobacterium botniense]